MHACLQRRHTNPVQAFPPASTPLLPPPGHCLPRHWRWKDLCVGAPDQAPSGRAATPGRCGGRRGWGSGCGSGGSSTSERRRRRRWHRCCCCAHRACPRRCAHTACPPAPGGCVPSSKSGAGAAAGGRAAPGEHMQTGEKAAASHAGHGHTGRPCQHCLTTLPLVLPASHPSTQQVATAGPACSTWAPTGWPTLSARWGWICGRRSGAAVGAAWGGPRVAQGLQQVGGSCTPALPARLRRRTHPPHRLSLCLACCAWHAFLAQAITRLS